MAAKKCAATPPAPAAPDFLAVAAKKRAAPPARPRGAGFSRHGGQKARRTLRDQASGEAGFLDARRALELARQRGS